MRKPVYLPRMLAAGLAAMVIALAIPARAESLAAADNSGSAIAASQKLRRLDIMLMVTSLRCRTTQDDFQADFQAFEAHHLGDLNAAAGVIVAQYTGRLGAVEANHALDRISVQIANQYGNGHPWLGCHELKFLAQELARQDGREVLLKAADEIFDGDGPPPVASAAPAIAEAMPGKAVAPVSLANR